MHIVAMYVFSHARCSFHGGSEIIRRRLRRPETRVLPEGPVLVGSTSFVKVLLWSLDSQVLRGVLQGRRERQRSPRLQETFRLP